MPELYVRGKSESIGVGVGMYMTTSIGATSKRLTDITLSTDVREFLLGKFDHLCEAA